MRGTLLARFSLAAAVAAAATVAAEAFGRAASAVPAPAFVGGAGRGVGTALGRRRRVRFATLAARVSIEARTAATTQKERDAAAGPHHSGRSNSRSRPLVHAKQLNEQEVRRRWPDGNFDVPVDMNGAVQTFFLGSPTPGLIIAGILLVVAARVLLCGGSAAPFGLADAAAVPLVALGWSFQEWAIHKYLLHGLEDWLGHDVHQAHHDKPFYHVCVDPPDLVAGWTLAAACVFGVLLPLPLALTVLATYMSMGLVYEWVHFIVHTRVVPRTRLGKDLKRHHTLHHLKDETCWLAFTAPPIDTLLGTVPPPPPPRPKEQAPSTAAGIAGAGAVGVDVAVTSGGGGVVAGAGAARGAGERADDGGGGGGGGH